MNPNGNSPEKADGGTTIGVEMKGMNFKVVNYIMLRMNGEMCLYYTIMNFSV